MASLERIFVHPIKSLDATARDDVRVVTNGGLEWDRRYAMVDADGEYVNGKRTARVHRIRARYDLDAETVTLSERGDGGDRDDARRFHLEDDRDALESWLSERFGFAVELVRDDEGGLPDDTEASGPTVISAETLETVASWFDGIDAAEMRRRLRPNLVVSAGTPFWEDRLYDEPGRTVPFSIGEVDLRGVNPCQRCVVPSRDPDTGAETDGFRERFLERREATLPEWAGEAWFDHYYRLMVNTRVAEASWGRRLAVGDEVEVAEPVDESTA